MPVSRRACIPPVAGLLALIALWPHSRGFPLPSLEKRWSIGIYTGRSPFDLQPAPGAANPVVTASMVTDAPAWFVADPFLVRDGGGWHMLFEVFNARSHHGDIGLASSPDGLRWTYESIVLDEPFHLSYPYVFSDGSEHYLIPESPAPSAVRLYRAARFPKEWVFVTTLVSGAGFADASVARHDGRWWLFTAVGGRRNTELRLYHAADLLGPWTEHPASPVARGTRVRPAGRVIELQGRLFRFAQDGMPSYGSRVWTYEVVELSVNRYREREASPTPALDGSGHGWNGAGMHHIDPQPRGPGMWLASVDGWRREWTLGFRRLRLW